MEELKGIGYLQSRLRKKRTKVLTRYSYYEMHNIVRDFGISTPPELKYTAHVLGWCAKAVDSLADRLQFIELKNDLLGMNEIFKANNKDILFDSAMLGALISSCSFIYISMGEDGNPILQTIDGGNATGIIDPQTGLLKEGYAVLERNEIGGVKVDAYFTPTYTEFYEDGGLIRRDPNPTGWALLVPIIYRPDAARPFGHSRISRACMSTVDSACRTIKRSEISAEFYSFPQKYITGLSPDAEVMDKWKAAMSSLMVFTKDEEGERPSIGQFQQQTMTPHLDQLKMFASTFAGETGLTLDDLGFTTDNPTSADAIRSAHEGLRLTARKAQRTFGTGIINAGFLAAALKGQMAYRREIIKDVEATWEPLFEPDAAMLASIADGVLKLNQAVPNAITEENLRALTGIR